MKDINQIEYFEGVKILVRVDFNVPLEAGKVSNGFRIKAALPTIKFLAEKGSKVILLAHLETREGENVSLEPVFSFLEKELQALNLKSVFVPDYKKAQAEIEGMSNGTVALLENVRIFEGEKKNDPAFSRELASLADIYVNDAFSVSHREHASVVGIPKLIPGYAGLQMATEVKELSRAFNPAHPFLFVLGGAKFSTKVPLVQRFLDSADRIFIGGALANDFFKAKGYEVGQSVISKEPLDLAMYLKNSKIILPVDVVNENREEKIPDSISKSDKIVDFGRETVNLLRDEISKARFILWNGPLGFYEKGFTDTTIELAKMMAEATKGGAITLVGGGDTIAAIASLGLEDSITFISTGGGAMLDFLAKGTLPGIEALKA